MHRRTLMLIAVALAISASCVADSILVRGYEFDRGNVLVHDVGMSYADTEPVLLNAGELPNTMEYDLDIPVTAEYEIWGRYAAMQSRPVDILLDGETVVVGFRGTTGSWQSSTAAWESQAKTNITAGKHTIGLICRQGCIPHIIAFRLDTDAEFPDGWRRKPKSIEDVIQTAWSGNPEPGKYGYQAYVRPDGTVDAPDDYNPIIPYERVPAPAPRGERILEYTLMGDGYDVQAEVGRDEWDETWIAKLSVEVAPGRVETEALTLEPERIEKMLDHTLQLIDDFGTDGLADEKAKAKSLLAKLADTDGPGLYDLYLAAYQLKHKVALSNPLLDFDRLLLAKRLTYNTSHIYTTYFDGSDRYGPGGGIYALNGVRPDGTLESLTSGLDSNGIFRDPDLSFDGTRVLFSHKPDKPTANHIYEVNIDGTGLRQLTDSDYDDIDPCYLPSGKIIFISTRCRRVVLCHNAFTVSVLYTMDADGSDVRCASRNTVNDFTPSVLADGRVAYTRWEYIDKQLGNNQSLWITNPDGTSPIHVAGEHWGPITLWEPRQVPNSPLIVTTLAPHMPIAVGPIALVDPADSCSSPAKFTNITPEIPPPHHFGWHRPQMGYYCNPWPLSEDYYIVAYAYGPDDRAPAGYGIYLLDRWNNRDLIYRDPDMSLFEAIPVKPRPEPPPLPEKERLDDEPVRFCVLDVYQGLDSIERGTVKWLRVVEDVPKPVAASCGGYGLQYPVMSNYGHLALKRVWGTVPVEEDGSAYFEAPANSAVYFSALDEDYMEIQRMRSFTQGEPGEVVSCIGCHEHRTDSPPNGAPLAMLRAPSRIVPPPDGVHSPDFPYDVQPVLDRHCIACHGGDSPKGNLDLTGKPTNLFSVAYESLTTRGLVSFVNAQQSSTLPLRPPMYYGSHASRLIEALRTSHEDRVHLPPDDWRRLVTWIDCNAPYYGTYEFTRPGTIGGRELLTPPIKNRLTEVYNRRCADCHGQDVGRAHRIDFAEPMKSAALLAPLAKSAGGTEACGRPVLGDRDDPDAAELIGALEQLSDEIRTNPRMDMLSRRPDPIDPDARYVYRP